MTETIKVSESLELHAVAENHVTPLYQLICISALMQHYIALHRFSRVLFTLNKLRPV